MTALTHPIPLRWSLLTLCLSSSVWAQTPAQPADSQQGLLRLGEYLIREGEPAAACFWLGQMQAAASLEPNRQYLLSHCLRDQGQINAAWNLPNFTVDRASRPRPRRSPFKPHKVATTPAMRCAPSRNV